MRILALSDIHGAYRLAGRIVAAEAGVDLVILAGDLTTNGGAAEAGEAVAVLRAGSPGLLAVAGNMDSPEIDSGFHAGGIGLNGRGVLVGGTGFCGVSGGPHSPLHTPYESSEDAMLELAEKGWGDIAQAGRKVFVPHAPPFNTKLDVIRGGIHVGSTAVRTFIEQRQPDLLICGHIHEAWGIDRIGKTVMVNCGSAREGRYAVIDIQDDITASNRLLGGHG